MDMFAPQKSKLRERIRAGTLNRHEAGAWLYEYVTGGDVEMVAELLKVPGVTRYRGPGGVSPLHQAVRGHYDDKTKHEIATLLVRHGADTNFRDESGYTPLHYAAFYGVPGMCRFLAANGSRLDARDRNRETPLHWAVRATEAAPVVTALLDLGADIGLRNRYRQTPVQVARQERRGKAYGALQQFISTRHARKVKRLGRGRGLRPG